MRCTKKYWFVNHCVKKSCVAAYWSSIKTPFSFSDDVLGLLSNPKWCLSLTLASGYSLVAEQGDCSVGYPAIDCSTNCQGYENASQLNFATTWPSQESPTDLLKLFTFLLDYFASAQVQAWLQPSLGLFLSLTFTWQPGAIALSGN